MTTSDANTPTPDTSGSSASAGQTPLDQALDTVMNYFTDPAVVAPLNQILGVATYAYLDAIDPEDPPEPGRMEVELTGLVAGTVRTENAKAGSAAEKIQIPKVLAHWQIAQILIRLHHAVRIAPVGTSTDQEYDIVAMYRSTGSAYGTYTTSEDDIRTMARRYHRRLSLADFKEVMAILREDTPRVHKCLHPDLIAVKSGVLYYGQQDADITVGGKTFHFKAKKVHPFDPAMVFTTKPHIDYVENPPKQVITHPTDGDWEVIDWIHSLSDDEGVPELLLEIIGAVIRPNVRWNKTAWFYSERGNNGKGTLCELIRNLVGPDAYTALPLAQFGDEFALEPLMKVSSIITDENDVGTFIDKAANLKAIVTNDVIRINRKYRSPVAYQFRGFMIQCLNEFPRAKDKSDSFYRRQLFIPFSKWFGGGDEKRYIKDDYLHRTEVLEYVLWYVINKAGAANPGNYYQLSEPIATKEVLDEYKEANDPVRAFWEEFRDKFAWDLLPFPFLYPLYKGWFAEVSPSGSPVGLKQFITDLVTIVRDDDDWHCPDKNRKIRPKQMMDDPEPLIAAYDLKQWMDPHYSGSDPLKKSCPVLSANYRGVLRHASTGVPPTSSTDTTDEEQD